MKKNTGIAYPSTFSNKSIMIVADDEYVRQSLIGLVRVTKGELLGDPEFGSNLMLYLFETNTSALIDLVSNDIYESVTRYLPQVLISRSGITGEVVDDTVKIRVNYSYNNSNGVSTIYIDLQGGQ